MNSPLLPQATISDTEATIIAKALTEPAVRKYLTNLANITILEIVSGRPEINETAESYLRRQESVKGRLEAINTLLLVQTAQAVSL